MIDNNQIIPILNKALDGLGVDYNEIDNRISMACPIHGSDNPDSLSIMLEGDSVNGVWKCWTNSCERKHGQTLFHLIYAIYETKKSNPSTKEVIAYLKQFTDLSYSNFKVYSDTKIYKNINIKRETGKIYRDQVRDSLSIPAEFYLKKGFSKAILDRYDIGVSYKKNREMFMRVVTPIYDDDHETMIGCSGRNQNQQCPKCKKYHIKNCPKTPLEKKWGNKWINSKGFNKSNHLYNFWYARKKIIESGEVILVEGQPDVWKLEESGIHNGLAIFGTKLSEDQFNKLNSLPIYNLIIAMDNDKAGKEARKTIEEQCQRYYNIQHIITNKKDIGDSSISEVQNLFKHHI